jgi:uncharacterized membrane protein (DUF4010 family)
LLIGGERERRKRQKRAPVSAGLRTFAVAALVGALSYGLGGAVTLAVATAAVGLLAAVAGREISDEDPGITTEVALLFTVLLGGLADAQPMLAAGVGVTVAILLAARSPLHRFVGEALTEDEVRDALVFAAATLVVLPLAPNRAMGPFGALNPHAIWIVVILVLTIGGVGHAAMRLAGARLGLPIAGLASGFVSSIATIGAMGARAAKAPAILPAAVAAAVLSTVATLIEMAAVIAATSVPTLRALAGPLLGAGLAAVAYGAAFTLRALRQPLASDPAPGHAFSLKSALLFAGTLSVVLAASAALRAAFGEAGSIAAAALAGLVDAHAAAVSIASLVATGRMAAPDAVAPILAGLTTNTVTKLILAASSGGRAFAVRVIPGLILVVAAAWGAALAVAGLAWPG